AWLRGSGLADVVVDRARRGAPVLGICGGYQMLTDEIVDAVEGEGSDSPSPAAVPGLGLLPGRVDFGEEKVLARPATTWRGLPVGDDFRRRLLTGVAAASGSGWRAPAGGTPFASRRERMIDLLADAIEIHVDVDALLTLIEENR